MRKLVITLLLAIGSDFVQTDPILIDQIDCVVCGPKENRPFTNTESTYKKDSAGNIIPLQVQIQNEIVAQQIVADKIPIDFDAAEKYAESIKMQHNLTDSGLAELFSEAGKTLAEGKASLVDQYAYAMFMHYKFQSQLVVSDDDVKEYCDKNPIYLDGWCEVQVANIDCDVETKETIRKSLDNILLGKTDEKLSINWSSPIKVKLDDLVKNKQFIFDMEPSQVKVVEDKSGFELYKLIMKREPELQSYEDRRTSIVDRFNKEKLESMMKAYSDETRKFIDVIDLSGIVAK